MSSLDEANTTLLRQLAITARGSRRDGLFALWLTLRVADDLVEPPAMAERAQRRRVQALEKRLTSLTLPGPLRRALAGTMAQFRELRPEAAACPGWHLLPAWWSRRRLPGPGRPPARPGRS